MKSLACNTEPKSTRGYLLYLVAVYINYTMSEEKIHWNELNFQMMFIHFSNKLTEMS